MSFDESFIESFGLNGIALITALYAAVSSLFLVRRSARLDRAKIAREDAEETLDSKLRLLAAASERAAQLSNEVMIEVDALAVTAANAKSQAEDASNLAALSAEQRKAVAKLVRTELIDGLEGGKKSDLRRDVVLGTIFFALGIVASVVVAWIMG
jgi:hypothetical protein